MPTKRREPAAAAGVVEIDLDKGAQSRAATRAPTKQILRVVRGKGPRVKITLTVGFDPDVIGEDRARAIYGGYAEVIKAVLSPEEAVAFIEKLGRAARVKEA
jgi:hypothetical protein